MKIVNIIERVDDGKPRRREVEKITTIAVHRVGKDLKLKTSLGDTAEEICDRFRNDPEVAKYTGGEIAYTLMIEADGTVKQCLPIDDVGQHAARWNTVALGVAMIGDFRVTLPSLEQRTTLIELLAMLCMALGLDPRAAIRGHDELPGGTKSPGKSCPGEHVNMPRVREDVLDFMETTASRQLVKDGIVWERKALLAKR